MKRTFTKLLGGVLCALFLMPSSAEATPITATWNFAGNEPAGIQSATNYGSNKEVYIASTQSGVDLYVNTGTSGKFSMNGGTSNVQMNAGTIVHVPVVSTNDVLRISFAGNSDKCTINGENCSSTALETYNVIATDVSRGYVVLGVSDNGTYINYISVDLAYSLPVKPIVAWDWENDTSIRTFDAIEKGSSKETGSFVQTVNGVDYTLEVDCTEAGKFGPNSGTPQFTTGAKLRVPVTSIQDKITIKIYQGEGKKVTIRGNDYAVATPSTSGIGTYTAIAEDVTQGYVEIVSACSYLYSVILEKNEYFTTASIGSTGWATFSNTFATDFTNLVGVVDAYQVTGNTGSAITKSAVSTTAAANTGLLLNAAAGTYAIPLTTTGTDLSGTNKLKAVASSTAVGAAEGDFTNFVLVGGSGTASFKKITGSNSATVGAGKAYLQLAGTSFEANLFFLDDDATAINAVKSNVVENGTYYNLAGQRVDNPTKGLYIVNGKKVIVK